MNYNLDKILDWIDNVMMLETDAEYIDLYMSWIDNMNLLERFKTRLLDRVYEQGHGFSEIESEGAFLDFVFEFAKEQSYDGLCKYLIEFGINPNICTGCGLCKKNCPQNAISGETKSPHVIAEDLCIKCGVCFELCNFDAVIKKDGGI